MTDSGAAALTDATGPAGALTRAELVLRDNLLNRSRIERAYRRAIGEARHDIIIANAYFVPGGKLRKALIHAATRGVRVRLLLQGRYEYFMQYHACRPVYGALLCGLEIHGTRLPARQVAVITHWAWWLIQPDEPAAGARSQWWTTGRCAGPAGTPEWPYRGEAHDLLVYTPAP
jgi:hypothetical protein